MFMNVSGLDGSFFVPFYSTCSGVPFVRQGSEDAPPAPRFSCGAGGAGGPFMSATDRRVAGVNGFVAAAAPRSVVDRLVDAVFPVVALLALEVRVHDHAIIDIYERNFSR